jgi:xanthine/CO dehydrogenase XdhC/CoxF family maturation factor
MSVSLQRLLPLFERERAAGQPMVLATVVRTAGPTYSKPGAHMLITERGEYTGLLSGGCLEGDLAQRADRVLRSGAAQVARYDMRGPDDLLFGLGSGCEGAMDILLQRLDRATDWQPMSRLANAWQAERADGLLLVVSSGQDALPPGAAVFRDGEVFGVLPAASASRSLQALRVLAASQPPAAASAYLAEVLPKIDVLALHQSPPARLLLLGAGPDAQPVVELATFLGWKVIVVDHRSSYARATRFPTAAAVLEGGPALVKQLTADERWSPFVAAVVMSHHLATDLGYLQALIGTEIPYIGLLGPPARRERLLAQLDTEAQRLRARLFAPVGLDIGGQTPEAIALSIVAEIHASIAARLPLASRPLQPADAMR